MGAENEYKNLTSYFYETGESPNVSQHVQKAIYDPFVSLALMVDSKPDYEVRVVFKFWVGFVPLYELIFSYRTDGDKVFEFGEEVRELEK